MTTLYCTREREALKLFFYILIWDYCYLTEMGASGTKEDVKDEHCIDNQQSLLQSISNLRAFYSQLSLILVELLSVLQNCSLTSFPC